MAKEGEEGRTKLNQYTRIFTIAITFIQAFGFLATLTPWTRRQPDYQ